jgi:hypothetical protein
MKVHIKTCPSFREFLDSGEAAAGANITVVHVASPVPTPIEAFMKVVQQGLDQYLANTGSTNKKARLSSPDREKDDNGKVNDFVHLHILFIFISFF